MRKLLYTLLVVMTISACSDELDKVPEYNLSDASFWITTDDFIKAANDFYSYLGSPGSYDNNSDIAYGQGPDAVSNGKFLPEESDRTWDDAYKVIRGTSILIEKAETSEAEVDRYVAEAKWFRALAYYRLVEKFGDVPLITKSLTLSSEELYGARTPRTQVIDFILTELGDVATKLPKEDALAAHEKGRITQGGAYALQARVALFEGTWSKYHAGDKSAERLQIAIDAAKKVMDSKVYSMFTYAAKPEQSYRYQFIEEGNDSPEQIVARRYHEDVEGHAFQHWVMHGGSYDVTKKLTDMYLCTDGLPIEKSPLWDETTSRATMVSEFENRDPRFENTVIKPGTVVKNRNAHEGAVTYPELGNDQGLYKTYKFVSEFIPGYTWGRSEYFHHEIRYAEVLLIYAEALFERDGKISNADLNMSINVIRDRVNMKHLSNEFVNENGLDMQTEIRRERTVELALDGRRLTDLRRWKTAEVELVNALKGVKFVGTEFATHFKDLKPGTHLTVDADGFIIVESAENRTWNDRQYLFPLPLAQLNINENLKPNNPGW